MTEAEAEAEAAQHLFPAQPSLYTHQYNQSCVYINVKNAYLNICKQSVKGRGRKDAHVEVEAVQDIEEEAVVDTEAEAEAEVEAEAEKEIEAQAQAQAAAEADAKA